MRIGIAGFGFMGRMHYANWNHCDDIEVAAICERNPAVLEELNTPVGNIEGASQPIDLSRLTIYDDFSTMLAEARLDAVSITLPTHLHAACSIEALQAGVHVLCEKPMALTTEECDRMIAAAECADRQLMIGHCIRFWPEYVWAKEAVDSGRYGKVISATFQRLSAAPTWSRDNWLGDDLKSGGMVLDLHIHDSDFVQYVFGIPEAVCSHISRRSQSIVHLLTQYDYGDSRTICAEASWAATPTFEFEMSFNIMLEEATLVYDCTRQPAFRVCPAEGQVFTPQLESGDGYAHEIAHFAAMIREENRPTVLTPQQSRESVRLVQAERQSGLENRKIRL